MRFIYSLLVGTAFAVESPGKRQSEGKLTKPEHAGVVLKEAFEKFSDLYSKNRPKNMEDMVKDSNNVLASFCDENDSECIATVQKLVEEEFEDAENGPEDVYFPDDFDPKLMKYIEKVESTLQQLSMDNVDDTLQIITKIKEDVENVDSANPNDKDAALIGVHVALQSAQLWHKAYSDPSHPLYGFHDSSHYFDASDKDGEDTKERELKEFDIATITLTEFQAAFNRGTRMLSEDGIGSAVAAARDAILASVTKRCYGYYHFYYGYHTHNRPTLTPHKHPHPAPTRSPGRPHHNYHYHYDYNY